VTGVNTDGACKFSGDLNWVVKGVSPAVSADASSLFYQFSVKGGSSGTLSLSVTNADCTPHTWSTTPGTSYPAQYWEYTVESTARVENSCTFTGATYDMSGTPIGDVTRSGSFTANGFDGSFTLPAPVHENDFPHIGVELVYEPIITERTYEISQAGAAPTLVSTRTGLHPAKGEVAGTMFYFKDFIVEGK
jgi:hypothetical protein